MSTLVPPTKTPSAETHAQYASKNGEIVDAVFVDARIDRVAAALRELDAVEPPVAKSHDRQ
jgi:hypothetical protein